MCLIPRGVSVWPKESRKTHRRANQHRLCLREREREREAEKDKTRAASFRKLFLLNGDILRADAIALALSHPVPFVHFRPHHPTPPPSRRALPSELPLTRCASVMPPVRSPPDRIVVILSRRDHVHASVPPHGRALRMRHPGRGLWHVTPNSRSLPLSAPSRRAIVSPSTKALRVIPPV